MATNVPDQTGITKRAFLKTGAGCACAWALLGAGAPESSARGLFPEPGFMNPRRSPWFTALSGDLLRCELCPRHCRLAAGQRGACRVRENRDGQGYTLVYGNPSLVQVDPVERGPFFHVLPGTRALSVSTAGCNMACRFCEAWDMALVHPEDVHAHDMPPEEIVSQAREARARAIHYAFGEPVIFYEYMEATARLAREAGLLNLVHSNGYIAAEPLRALCPFLDAANIDLKSFDPDFYRDVCEGDLTAVLDTLKALRDAGVHLEITTPVIPSLSDDPDMLRALAGWIARELGPDVPLHLARFYPLYKLANLPPTPVRTLDRARADAMAEGLRYVYVSRVTGHEGEHTYCPGCRAPVIRRLGFIVEEVAMTDGRCDGCGAAIPGRWTA